MMSSVEVYLENFLDPTSGRAERDVLVRRVVRAAANWEAFARRHGIGERERSEFAPMFQRQLEELRTAFSV